jgi:hypothetical protein
MSLYHPNIYTTPTSLTCVLVVVVVVAAIVDLR